MRRAREDRGKGRGRGQRRGGGRRGGRGATYYGAASYGGGGGSYGGMEDLLNLSLLPSVVPGLTEFSLISISTSQGWKG